MNRLELAGLLGYCSLVEDKTYQLQIFYSLTYYIMTITVKTKRLEEKMSARGKRSEEGKEERGRKTEVRRENRSEEGKEERGGKRE